ncbi:MAG: MarR family winged helix-turn-helix transcriptional regulator [Burkholderiales bacterium]
MIDLNRQTQLREAIELFYFGYRAFTAHPDRVLEQRGLGRVHHRILYFVARNPDTSVNTLLGVLGVTKQALNGPLRQLIEMKQIAMRTAPHDGRVKQLRLTYEGEKLEARLTQTQMKQLDAVFSEVGPQAQAAWGAVMHALSKQE